MHPQDDDCDNVATDMDVTLPDMGPAPGRVSGNPSVCSPSMAAPSPEEQRPPLASPSSPHDADCARPMDTSGVSSNNRSGVPSPASLPYNMPPGVWSHVAATNLRLQREQHCLSSSYFRFMSEVVKAWRARGSGDGGSGSSKMRRVGESSGVAPDLPRPPAADRRPEDTASAVATAAKLGISFFFDVFCHSSMQPRDDWKASIAEWEMTLSALIRCSSTIALQFLVLCFTKRWLLSHLQSAAPEEVRWALVALLDAACDCVFIRHPDHSPSTPQSADLAAVQLVSQLCDHAHSHLAAAVGDYSKSPDFTTCFEACVVLCRDSHVACGVLLSDQAGSVSMRKHLISVVSTNDRFPPDLTSASLHLAAVLLLSTTGPPVVDDTLEVLVQNPYSLCSPGIAAHPWPEQFTPQVTNLCYGMTIALTTACDDSLLPGSRQMTSFPQHFVQLMCLLSWEQRSYSIPVITNIHEFLERATFDRIKHATQALIQMMGVPDSLCGQRLTYFLQPKPESPHRTASHRSQDGLLGQILRAIAKNEFEVCIAFLRLLHGIAASQPPDSWPRMRLAIWQPQAVMPKSLQLKLAELQDIVACAQSRFNEPGMAKHYAWTAEPGLADLLEDCKSLLSDEPQILSDSPSTSSQSPPAQ